MGQSLAQNYIHLVFSTKHRTPWFNDRDVRQRVHSYLAAICNELNSEAFQIGGVGDHVHIFCQLSKNIALAKLIEEVKKESSKWIKKEFQDLRGFRWQAGYGAFSISPSHVSSLKKYILTQEEHHKGQTFKQEFRHLCEKYGVPIDERYAWD